MSASAYVEGAMRACLPEVVPLSFSLVSARWVGSGRKRRAQASVTMFDGQPASLEVWRWSDNGGDAHMWTDMPGGDASFEAGRWIRVDRGLDEAVLADAGGSRCMTQNPSVAA